MSNRIMDRERRFINTFKESADAVKLPFNKIHHIVMQNKTLVTIY